LVTFLAISVAKMVKIASAMLIRPIEREIVSLVVTVLRFNITEVTRWEMHTHLVELFLRLELFCI
jgi:hypothetical protein